MKWFKTKSKKRGAAAVECAIVLPVFVIILLGTIETCSMIFLQQSLKIAAYEGARVALIPKSTTASVEKAANDILNVRRVKGFNVTITPSNFSSQAYGTLIRVDVSAPCNSNSPFVPFFYNAQTLTGSVEMMKEF